MGTPPTGKIVARPMVAQACGCQQEFQHFEVDKYRAQRLAKFQRTRWPACVAKLIDQQKHAGKHEENGASPGDVRPEMALLHLHPAATVPHFPAQESDGMKDGPNARIHAVRVALQELGDATPEMVSAFVAQRFDLEIVPSIVPLIRAIIADRERLEARRVANAAQKRHQATGDTDRAA